MNHYKHLFRTKKVTVITVVLGLLLSVYAYQCLFQKVCGVPILDTLIRNNIIITTPKGEIDAEVVDTEASRHLGLSGRTKLKDGKGMLFVFEESGKYGFWMKDMSFALDLIWIDEEGVVVSVERNVTPETYPAAFINTIPALYVLEVPAGESETLGIFLGTKVLIEDYLD